MELIQVNGGSVKSGKMTELQEWLVNNEAELASLMPDGIEWVGTYVAIYTSEKGMGTLFWILKQDSYGAADNLAASTGGRLAELLGEFDNFLDLDTDNWGSMLLKRTSDITIWGEN